MRSLLLRLALGLHEQDIHDDERDAINRWLAAGMVVKESTKYRFNSKYRPGTVITSYSIHYTKLYDFKNLHKKRKSHFYTLAVIGIILFALGIWIQT